MVMEEGRMNSTEKPARNIAIKISIPVPTLIGAAVLIYLAKMPKRADPVPFWRSEWAEATRAENITSAPVKDPSQKRKTGGDKP
jgi:hypothetical protein